MLIDSNSPGLTARLARLGLFSLSLALLAGCPTVTKSNPTSATSTSTTSAVTPAKIPVDKDGYVHIDTSKPIPFESHSFSAFCYSTYGCDVEYAGLPIAPDDKDKLQPSSESYGPDYQKQWKGFYLDIKNFPPPAKVSWRSKDGTAHQATVDIADIFKDQVVLHKVSKDKIKPVLTMPVFPSIMIEVNDRTINVWMRARIPTKNEQIPGNKYSFFRDDLILAWSKTY